MTQRTLLNLLHQMRAPLLILHGAHDTVATNDEVSRAAEVLQGDGTPCEVHVFEDTHGLPLHTDEAVQLLVAFLAKHTNSVGE